MRFSLKTLGAAVALALASASALATTQADIPAQPVAGPTPNGDNGNGGLLVVAWDGTKSISQYLGLNYLNVEKNDLTTSGAAGISLNFGTLGSFASTFADTSLVQWAVFAADNAKSGDLGAGLTTTVSDPSFITPDIAPFFGVEYSVAAGAIANFANVLNGQQGCNGVNPCVATTNSSEAYAGKEALGASISALPFTVSASLGTALQMFNFTTIDTAGTGAYESYSVGNRIGTWLLNAAGELTYSFPSDGGTTPPVPLPAGVWLLISGLTGLGVIGRRRKAGEVVAA